MNIREICFQIGNPLLDFDVDYNSRAEFLWTHGVLSDSTYQELSKDCNYSQIVRQDRNHNLTSVCSRVLNLVASEIGSVVDNFDITLDECLLTNFSQAASLDKLVSKYMNCYFLLIFNIFGMYWQLVSSWPSVLYYCSNKMPWPLMSV